MTDYVHDYNKLVRKRLVRAESEPFLRMVEALYFPSFHAETVLRVVERPEGSVVRFFTFTSSLWWYSGEANEPTRCQEIRTVPPKHAERFWNSIEKLNPPLIHPGEVDGCDGMSVTVLYQLEDSKYEFETWSPAPDTPDGIFIRTIVDLARRTLKSAISRRRLKELKEYL